mmetsp:Transcript_22092/g.21294  ORF Transcript_22092/g.21294 Transcript_22092/m.21294 type:complete len:117 (+) Transcript_22092:1086-1436(+)
MGIVPANKLKAKKDESFGMTLNVSDKDRNSLFDLFEIIKTVEKDYSVGSKTARTQDSKTVDKNEGGDKKKPTTKKSLETSDKKVKDKKGGALTTKKDAKVDKSVGTEKSISDLNMK